jgi:hypothetical protein
MGGRQAVKRKARRKRGSREKGLTSNKRSKNEPR